jgi:hypothetical protein
MHYYYYYYYFRTHLLQLNFHPVAVELTLIQKKTHKYKIHKGNNTKTQYKQHKSQ